MRTALAVIVALGLCVTPAVAQGKTKGGSSPAVSALAVEVVEICEQFAADPEVAIDASADRGWDSYEDAGESPYVRTFSAYKHLPGIGEADIFVLFEDYPQSTLGYCRMDVIEPQGRHGGDAIGAIQDLARYDGQSQTTRDGIFAHLAGIGAHDDTVILTHWSADSFVVQLTTVAAKAAETD